MEACVAYFKVLSQNSPGGNKENGENFDTARRRIEMRTWDHIRKVFSSILATFGKVSVSTVLHLI
jgi:hypothetical protein